MTIKNYLALLMIDMHHGFLNAASPCYIAGATATVPACANVIQCCRAKDIPVFFATRLYRVDGSDVEHTRFPGWLSGGKPISPVCASEISAAMPEAFGHSKQDYHITKPSFSAFFHTELDLILRLLGAQTILLAGTTTPNCIRTTCYDGISLEYNIPILSDCTSSVTEEIQQSNLRDMANIGAQILTSEDWISGKVTIDDHVAAVQQAVLSGV